MTSFPLFHAIELALMRPYLFYQPVNDRARGKRPLRPAGNRFPRAHP
jgi:hypothetical protein